MYEVRPGLIATDMTARVKDQYDAMIEDGLLLQPRWGQPEDVGHAVAALARGDFSYSTGGVFELSGGNEHQTTLKQATLIKPSSEVRNDPWIDQGPYGRPWSAIA